MLQRSKYKYFHVRDKGAVSISFFKAVCVRDACLKYVKYKHVNVLTKSMIYSIEIYVRSFNRWSPYIYREYFVKTMSSINEYVIFTLAETWYEYLF